MRHYFEDAVKLIVEPTGTYKTVQRSYSFPSGKSGKLRLYFYCKTFSLRCSGRNQVL